jgi:hypothetical protein
MYLYLFFKIILSNFISIFDKNIKKYDIIRIYKIWIILKPFKSYSYD